MSLQAHSSPRCAAHFLRALGWYYSEVFGRDRDWQGDGVITLLGAQEQPLRMLKRPALILRQTSVAVFARTSA